MSEDNPEDKNPQEKQNEQQVEQHGKEMKNYWSETPADSSSLEQTGVSPNQETANRASQENRDYIQSIQNQSYDNPTPLDTPKGPESSSENKDPQETQSEKAEEHTNEMKARWSETPTPSSSPEQAGTSPNQEIANRFSPEVMQKAKEATGSLSLQGSDVSYGESGNLRPLDTPKVSPPESSPPDGNYRAIWKDKPIPQR